MTAVMILTPPRDDDRVQDRKGDAFDTAFVEILRTLDGQGRDDVPVLAPWSPDLAPLVAAALVDTAPSFDPEGGGSAVSTRSRIVPYALASDSDELKDGEADRETVFWRGSHLSLGLEAPVPMAAAIEIALPTHLVVLGLPNAAADVAGVLEGGSVNILCFESLVSRSEVAATLGVPFESVEDLERRLPAEATSSGESPASARERDAEDLLEPYVPYGLLLQAALDEFLPGNEREGGEAA